MPFSDVGGGNAEFVVVDEELVMHIPTNMSFTDAAAVPEAWLTAFQLVHLVGAYYVHLITLHIVAINQCFNAVAQLTGKTRDV